MLTLLSAAVLCSLMVYTLRGGMVSDRGLTIVGMDIEGLGMGVLAFVAAAWYFGPLYGVAIVLSVMIHEFGHVAAFRIAGHDDARFRLIPLMGGVAISDRAPETQAHDFFISLMGPGICLAPMALAYALSEVVAPFAPDFAHFLWVFAIVTGALNFFNLMPFWPLDGGHCTRILTDTFAPGATRFVTLTMSAGLAALAVAMQSMALFFFAILGAQSLFSWSQTWVHRPAMTKSQGVIALGAYVFTAGAHLWGGFTMLARYL
ncbi:metalloprotease [Litoreibacter albidus]|uniref:Zn-dependent protease (Includes SpoIVFB) n=1 Tax=Litoreibacter albidus TaxID=670155 RepID=A0A1H3A9C1_9RHOB|nr:site-2 protease family protein [Litoreibacter albidus]SDX25469.1 Zn-dependent protease (includes SpoIVFB) [Litoreibacter albidus]